MGYHEYVYDYPSSYDISNSVFAAVLSLYLIMITVVLIFVLVSYIFHSLGLYTIAKRMGRSNPWLAFVPFARDYLHGELAGSIVLKKRRIRNPGIWKLILPIIYGVVVSIFFGIFSMIMGIGVFLSYGNVMTAGTILVFLVLLLVGTVLIVLYEAVYGVLRVMIDVQIYERFTTRNMAVVHAVLSTFIPLYEAICLFVLRNRPFHPGMEPVLTPPPIPPVRPVSPVHPVSPVPPVQPEVPVSDAPLKQPEAPISEEAPVHPETPNSEEAPVQPEPPVRSEVPVLKESTDEKSE